MAEQTNRFAGKRILVSGAAGGFGRAIAAALAEAGARLLLSDLSDDALARLKRDLAGSGAEVEVMAGDVAEEATHQRLVETITARFGGLDIVINNAGIAHDYKRLPEISADEAMKVIAIDLMGVFFALKHQIPAMDTRAGQKGGAIVNVASVAGLSGAPLLSVYSAAKHGVVGLTKSAAAENARRGIRVNAVCPSFARTPMVLGKPGANDPDTEAQIARGIPMRRLAEVEEVVAAVLFAADPANGFMTGVTLPVDGGLSAI